MEHEQEFKENSFLNIKPLVFWICIDEAFQVDLTSHWGSASLVPLGRCNRVLSDRFIFVDSFA